MAIVSVFSNRTVVRQLADLRPHLGSTLRPNDVRRLTIVARSDAGRGGMELIPVLEEEFSSVHHRKHHGLDIVTVQVEARITPGAHGAPVCGVYIAAKERGGFFAGRVELTRRSPGLRADRLAVRTVK